MFCKRVKQGSLKKGWEKIPERTNGYPDMLIIFLATNAKMTKSCKSQFPRYNAVLFISRWALMFVKVLCTKLKIFG